MFFPKFFASFGYFGNKGHGQMTKYKCKPKSLVVELQKTPFSSLFPSARQVRCHMNHAIFGVGGREKGRRARGLFVSKLLY